MRVTRRQALTALLRGGGAAVVAGSAYGGLYERHAFRLVERTLAVPGLAAGLDGLRVGILTDIHRGSFLSRDELDHVVAMLNGARPDLIALLGDFVTWRDTRYAASSAEALGALRAPHGVLAVLGNHDDTRVVPRELAGRSITVLDDSSTTIAFGNTAVDVAGIGYWTRQRPEIAVAIRRASRPPILLAHDPRRLAEAAQLGLPLVLSGHTHGGQISLPVLGPIAARKFPVAAGPAVRGATILYVSRGVGTVVVPVRLNCPPEAVVLTLRTGDRARVPGDVPMG
jgi:predicted MPP superfamily phosphohydrolase